MLKWPSLREMDEPGTVPRVRIHLCVAPTDMRCGVDALAQRVREGLGTDPLCGGLFLFISRGKNRIKILYWDHDGYALWYKRLEAGTFRMPRPVQPGSACTELKASELAMLLEGIDLRSLKRVKRYAAPGLPSADGPYII